MSDYDLQNTSETRRRAMDYAGESSGRGLWIVIGLVAVVALIAVLLLGAGEPGDGTVAAPAGTEGIAPPAEDAAPATAGTDAN